MNEAPANENKLRLIDRLSIAITSPKNYDELVKLSTGKVVTYMILISFLLAFIEFGINAITYVARIGGFENLILNSMPKFTYQDGTLDMEDEFSMDVGSTTIYVNTDYTDITLDDINSDGIYIAFGSSNVIMGLKSTGMQYTYFDYKLSDLFWGDFDNQGLSTMVPQFYMYIIFVALFVMVSKAVKILFLALVFTIIARPLAMRFNTGYEFAQVYKICIFGQTLSFLLTAVNTTAGYIIGPSLMTFITLIISFVYINRAIMSKANISDIPPGSL